MKHRIDTSTTGCAGACRIEFDRHLSECATCDGPFTGGLCPTAEQLWRKTCLTALVGGTGVRA